MTKSIIQTESFPKNFCTFGITVVLVDLNRSMSLSLIIISAFEFE